MTIGRFLLGFVLVATATASSAAIPDRCRPDPRVQQVAQAWLNRQAQSELPIAPDDAVCFRNELLEVLQPHLGKIVGYKVGLFTKAGQARFGASGPNVGVLHERMMVPAEQPISVRYGYAPLMEADFILVVKDAGINSASTPEEVFRHLRGYRPFMELPDNQVPYARNMKVDQFIALNANARLGTVGAEVALQQTAEGMRALRDMTVKMSISDGKGVTTSSARAIETLGDPLAAVLFAKNALNSEGRRLKEGDLISIGTILPARPPRAGETVQLSYQVLDKPSALTVTFVE